MATVIAKEVSTAKELLKQGKKEKAKTVLKQKRLQETLLDRSMNQVTLCMARPRVGIVLSGLRPRDMRSSPFVSTNIQ